MIAGSIRLRRGILLLILASLPASAFSQYRLCYFGDSITEGWIDAVRRPERAYPALLDSMLAGRGLSVSSDVTAHGGETTEDALARIDHDVMSARADVVCFAFGSNDYFTSGNPPASRVSLERFRHYTRIMFRKLAGTGMRVVVITPPPVAERRFYQLFDSTLYAPRGGVDGLRAAYTGVLEENAREFDGIRVLRVDSILADTSLLGFDGVHPTAEGHRSIASALLGLVVDALSAQRALPPPAEAMRAFPSPFLRMRSGVSVIGFSARSSGEYVLRVVDATGRLIRKMVYYAHAPGDHFIVWNARSDDGTMVAPGAYTLHLQSVLQQFQTHSLLVL